MILRYIYLFTLLARNIFDLTSIIIIVDDMSMSIGYYASTKTVNACTSVQWFRTVGESCRVYKSK